MPYVNLVLLQHVYIMLQHVYIMGVLMSQLVFLIANIIIIIIMVFLMSWYETDAGMQYRTTVYTVYSN